MISHYDCSGTALNVSAAAGRGSGRLRVMLLASGFPIKTILINQSLRDGSNLKPWFSLSKIAGHHPVTSDGARPSCPFTISSLRPPRTDEGQSPCDSHLKLIWPVEISFHPEPDCHIGEKIQLNFLFSTSFRRFQHKNKNCTVTLCFLTRYCTCWDFILWALHVSNAAFSIVWCQRPSFPSFFTGNSCSLLVNSWHQLG